MVCVSKCTIRGMPKRNEQPHLQIRILSQSSKSFYPEEMPYRFSESTFWRKDKPIVLNSVKNAGKRTTPESKKRLECHSKNSRLGTSHDLYLFHILLK